MLTLLSECHFWSIREDIRIKPTDFGAFRYAARLRRDLQQAAADDVSVLAKRDYTERRNGIAILKNSNRKGSSRLKDNIKKLEELLRSQRVVYAQWQDATVVLLLFSSGLIAYICVDIYTGDILRMVFEKYFVGKLAAEVITDAFFTRSHIVLAYNTNQLTVVYLQKPNVRSQGPEKISNMDPRIFHVIIPGPGERKLARHLAVNSSFDLFVIWTQSSQNEVYPWRPTVRDQDRANIHVFKLKGTQLESISYCWSENDPLCVDFLRSAESQILTVEQKVSRKGEISAETCSYEIISGKMQRTALSSIPLGTQICCYAFSPDQEKLFLGTIDRYICLHDLVHQNTQFVTQIDIIPTQCSWHSDSSMVMIANDHSQFQCYDLALTPIANQLQSEDVTPSNLLDLSHYFGMQQTLIKIAFSHKPDLTNFSQTYAQTECFLLLLFENGPLGCLRFFAGSGMRGDIHNSGLTADVIVDKYLSLNQLEKAVNLLGALNWDTYGAMCLISLHKIANYIFFRSDPKRLRVDLLAKALKTFADSLSEETKDEFSDQVFDLKRRFFFFLLRNNLYVDAFEVALDIEDYDLFMDLYNNTKAFANFEDFTATSFRHAAAILQEEDRENGNTSVAGDCQSESLRSQSSCSETTNVLQHNINLNQRHEKSRNILKNYVPPLPSIKSNVLNAEMIKINIPKPELRISAIEQERNQPLPPLPLPSVRRLDITPSMELGSNLASLTSKSNASQNRTNQINGNIHSNVSILWQQATNQTVGIPTILNAPSNPYVPSTAHNILPRASTTSSLAVTGGTNNNKQPLNATNFIHFASPAMTATPTTTEAPSASASQRRTFPQMPIPIYQPKFYQHPLVSGTIPPTSSTALNILQDDFQKRLQKKPAASILSNGSASQNGSLANAGSSNTPLTSSSKEFGGKSTVGEKNKVKFSDTVQVAVVPEISRKDKPLLSKKNGYSRPISSRNIMNPKKELADSLPLCHPNDDYLKDFNPYPSEDVPRPPPRTSTKEDQAASKSKKMSPPPPPSIKVVHFGVV